MEPLLPDTMCVELMEMLEDGKNLDILDGGMKCPKKLSAT